MRPHPDPAPADVEAGLRRLRLRREPRRPRTQAQRWAPEEVLRVLVEAEIASRDANTRNRMTAARFPIDKPSTSSASTNRPSREPATTTS